MTYIQVRHLLVIKKHTPNFDTVHGLEIEKYCESVAVAGSFSLADRPA